MDENKRLFRTSVVLAFFGSLIVLTGAWWLFGARGSEEVEAEREIVEGPLEPEVVSLIEEEPPPKEKIEPREAEEAPDESLRLGAEIFDEFQAAYVRHYERSLRPLLHFTIDRPLYRPGQDIHWQSWHMVSGAEGLLASRGGKKVKVALLNPRGEVVKEEEVETDRGIAAGVFEMDSDVEGGNWRIRVEDENRSYSRPVLVAHFEPPRFRKTLEFDEGAFRPGQSGRARLEIRRDTGSIPAGMAVEGYLQVGGAFIHSIEGELDFRGEVTLEFELPEVIDVDRAELVVTLEEGGLRETEVWPVPLALDRISVDFYPEGGSLVAGLPTRVYFEASDLSGEPVSIRGKVTDALGEVIAEVESVEMGRGRFEITPRGDQSYFLTLEEPVLPGSLPLPVIKEEGCTLRVYDDLDSQKEAIRVGVWCTENKVVGVVGAMGTELFDVTRIVAGFEKPGVVYLQPESGEWPRQAGIARVTVLEDSATIKPLAERVLFRGRRNQLDLQVHLERTDFHPGESVDLLIEARGPDGQPLPASLVRSLVDDRAFGQSGDRTPSILGRLLLSADDLHFWGEAERPDRYFDLYEDSALDLDLLMGVRGWRSEEKRVHYYVDGGAVRLPPPPPVVRRRAPRPPQRPGPVPRQRIEAMPMMDSVGGSMGMSGNAEVGRAMPRSAGGARPTRSMNAPSPGPTYVEELVEVVQSGPVSDDAPGAIMPRYLRDDDALAFSDWASALRTDEAGQLVATVHLPEAIGAYRLVLEGVGDGGVVGRTEKVLKVDAPLSVTSRLPRIASGGDLIQLPVTFRNTTGEVMEIIAQIEIEGPMVVMADSDRIELEVPARSTMTYYVPIQVYDARETAKIRVFAEGGGFVDGMEREVKIEPKGFQRRWHVAGSLPGTRNHELPLAGSTDAGVEATLHLYPGVVAESLTGLETMARHPTGCFEQTSASHYPNLLIWRHVRNDNNVSADLKTTLQGHLASGHSRLLTFEAPQGGFDWFGRPTPRASLTALALLQFTQMEELVSPFDRAPIERSVAYLRTLRDESSGGWRQDDPAVWHHSTLAGGHGQSQRLFVLYGLARSGMHRGFEAQFKEAQVLGSTSEDPQVVAYAAAALAYSGLHREALPGILRRLEGMQHSNGSFPAQGPGWTGGRGQAQTVEATGIATLAMIKGGSSRTRITRAINYLSGARTGSGWWGTTSATVAALDARYAFEEAGLNTNAGEVQVYVNGIQVGSASIRHNQREPSTIEGLGEFLSAEKNDVRIRSTAVLQYDLKASWRQEAFEQEESGALLFAVQMPEVARVGEALSMELILENKEDESLGMVVARMTLPAGLDVAPRVLDALVENTAVAFYETSGREVVFYFDDLAGNERQEIAVTATASLPGRFEVPSSLAFPYYRDEGAWQWSPPATLSVVP